MTAAIQQRGFARRISARAILVPMAVVRALFGSDDDEIRRRVNDATREDHLRWVFNLSAGTGVQADWHFWARELLAPEMCAWLSLSAVIGLILGRRRQFRRGELQIEWVCHPTTITHIIAAGELTLQGSTVPRDSLDNFLRSRWCGVKFGRDGVSPSLNKFTAPETDTGTTVLSRNGQPASIPARTSSK